MDQKQFQAFNKECIIDRSKSINDFIHSLQYIKVVQLTSLKSDVWLFSCHLLSYHAAHHSHHKVPLWTADTDVVP